MNKQAFTLVELLVVVLIIGILAAVALPQYNKAVEKSRAAQAISLVKTIYEALHVYYIENGQCAGSLEELGATVPWTGNAPYHDSTAVVDTRSNEDWSLQLIYLKNTDNCSVMVGRLAGPYQGGGFGMVLSHIELPAHQLLCYERLAEGVVFSKAAGSYCEGLFQGKKVYTSNSVRAYTVF